MNSQQKKELNAFKNGEKYFFTLAFDLGQTIGVHHDFIKNNAENKASLKTIMWGLANANNLLKILFEPPNLKAPTFAKGVFQKSLDVHSFPLLIIVGRPYLKSLKTSQYLIKQQAIIEYELLKAIVDRNVYLLELNEMTVNAWFKGHFKDQWNHDLKAKENKYQICINYLLENGLYELDYSEIGSPKFNFKTYNHTTDAYALYLYTKHNIEACVGKITPLKLMFAK